MISLVVIDLDGTLLTSNKEIHPLNYEAICRVQEMGIIVTIATGRGLCSTIRYANELKINFPIIIYNGASITTVDGQCELSRNSMPIHEVSSLIAELEQLDCYFKVYFDDYFLVSEESKATEDFSRSFTMPYRVVGMGNLSKIDIEPLKITIIDSSEKLNLVMQRLKGYSDRFNICRDGQHGIEITTKVADKGIALKKLCAEKRIPLANVVAFGNEGNDIGMINSAGIGIAMGNGFDDLKHHADFVSISSDDGGVAFGLEKYILHTNI